MKKIAFLICLLCLSINISFSQDDLKKTEGVVKWSEMYKLIKFRVGAQVAGQDGKFVYIVQGSGRKTVMEKYDINTLALSQSTPLSLKYKDGRVFPENYFMYDNKPAISATIYNRKTKYYKTIVFIVDPTSLVPSKPYEVWQGKVSPNEFSSVRDYTFGSAKDFLAKEMFVSANGEFAFTQEIIYSSPSKLGGQRKVKSLRGRLFDKNLKLIIKSNYNFPQEIFTQVQTKVGNDGRIYIGGFPTRLDKDLKNVMRGETEVYESVEVYVIDLTAGTLNTIKMEPGDREVKGCDFTVDADNNVTITGLTNLEGQGVSGSFFAKYDKDFNQVAVTFQDFEDDFLSQAWTDKLDKKVDKVNDRKEDKGKDAIVPDLYRYKIHNMVHKSDGSVTFLAEQYFVKIIRSSSQKTPDTYVYYFNDIIALNYDKSGELDWKTIIDKSQVSFNDNGFYSSFSPVLDGDEISFFFNGSEEKTFGNNDNALGNQMLINKNVTVVHVVLDSEGNQQIEKLNKFEASDIKMFPTLSSSIEGGKFFLFADSNNGFKLGTFTK